MGRMDCEFANLRCQLQYSSLERSLSHNYYGSLKHLGGIKLVSQQYTVTKLRQTGFPNAYIPSSVVLPVVGIQGASVTVVYGYPPKFGVAHNKSREQIHNQQKLVC